MNFRALAPYALSGCLLLAACSKITQENFARIQDGMSEQEVAAILGKPTESSSTSVLNMTGTASRWSDKGAVIVIRFVNNKVVLKSYDKPPEPKK